MEEEREELIVWGEGEKLAQKYFVRQAPTFVHTVYLPLKIQ